MVVVDDDGMIVGVGVEGGGIYWNIWMIEWVCGEYGEYGGEWEGIKNKNININNTTTIIITILII